MSKKYDINSSSLVDLKAELLRKQKQVQTEKSKTISRLLKAKPKEKKNDLWSRSNAGVRKRIQKDLEEKEEEEDDMAKSRKILEAKTKVYEKMTSSNIIPDEDGSKRFLVDFERKTIDKLVEQRQQQYQQEDQARVDTTTLVEEMNDTEDVNHPTDPEEEWVDYTDSLGRSRHCMKKDLSHLMDMDRRLVDKKTTQTEVPNIPGPQPDLMSADMYREKLREQWEKEEREAMEGPIHYSNVQFNERRSHGVGFYQFDKGEEQREQQMDELKKLREQTKDARASHKSVKDKRKAMLASRLAKVKQRKMIREGKDPSDIMDVEHSDSEDDIIGPRPEEQDKEPEPLTRDDSWRHTAPVRDWDKGKDSLEEFLKDKHIRSEEEWLEEQRQERSMEFAPPSIYQAGSAKSAKHSWGPPKVVKMLQSNASQKLTKDSLQEQDPHDRGLDTMWQQKSLYTGKKDPMAALEQQSFHKKDPMAALQQQSFLTKDPMAALEHQNLHKKDPMAALEQQNLHKKDPMAALEHTCRCLHKNDSMAALEHQSLNKKDPMAALEQQNLHKNDPMVALEHQSLRKKGMSALEQSDMSCSIETTLSAIRAQVDLENLSGKRHDATKKIPESDQNNSVTERDVLSGIPLPKGAYKEYTQEKSLNIPQTFNTCVGNTAVEYSTNYSGGNMSSMQRQVLYPNNTNVDCSYQISNLGQTYPQSAQTEQFNEPQVIDSGTLAHVIQSAPQPAHYAHGPSKPQPKQPKYERVLMHEIPLTLPILPPTVTNIPEYPSQEDVLGPRKKTDQGESTKQLTEAQAIKQWQRQFKYGSSTSGQLKPDNIPFASPYIQNIGQGKSDTKDPGLEFDPSRPPPPTS